LHTRSASACPCSELHVAVCHLNVGLPPAARIATSLARGGSFSSRAARSSTGQIRVLMRVSSRKHALRMRPNSDTYACTHNECNIRPVARVQAPSRFCASTTTERYHAPHDESVRPQNHRPSDHGARQPSPVHLAGYKRRAAALTAQISAPKRMPRRSESHCAPKSGAVSASTFQSVWAIDNHSTRVSTRDSSSCFRGIIHRATALFPPGLICSQIAFVRLPRTSQPDRS